MSEQQGRRPAPSRHRPLPPLTLCLVALLAACGPAPSPSVPPPSTQEPSPPAPAPSASAQPSVSPSATPGGRLVTLARGQAGAALAVWDGTGPIPVSLPNPGAHGLAIDGRGRAAIVTDEGVLVAERLLGDEDRWVPAPEFEPAPGEILSGLAWSPGGKLAWAGAAEFGVPPFVVVAGPLGRDPARIAVEADLDGSPVWLDDDRVAVLAVRDPAALLAVVSIGSGDVAFEPLQASAIAVSPAAGLIAVGARSGPRLELRPLERLGEAVDALAVLEGPDTATVGDVAFSVDGQRLAVTWLSEAALDSVRVYERSPDGWRETGRLEGSAFGTPGTITAVELDWLP